MGSLNKQEIPRLIISVRQQLTSIKNSKSNTRSAHSALRKVSLSIQKIQTSLQKLRSPSFQMQYLKHKQQTKALLQTLSEITSNTLRTQQLAQPQETPEQSQGLLQTNSFEIQLHYDIIHQRDMKINKVTESIFTVNSMLKQLGALVQIQGEDLDRIEDHIDDSVSKSGDALKQLAKAETAGKSSRQRQCLICLLVSIVLFLITMIFIENFSKQFI